MDINVKIECPELASAIKDLAEAVNGAKRINAESVIRDQLTKDAEPDKVVEDDQKTVDKKAEDKEDQKKAAPMWTMEQLAHAGSDLVASGKRVEVISLLNKFGIKSLVKATPDQYNAIGEELKALGAKL